MAEKGLPRFQDSESRVSKLTILRPRLHYDTTANTPLKIYYVSSIETILCLHFNGVICLSVLTTELYRVYPITEWFAVAY
jgi:hypothetical protein